MIAASEIVLGRVDRGDAVGEQCRRVVVGHDAADHDLGVHARVRRPSTTSRHERQVRTREDREPDDVDVLVARRRDDLFGRESDPLVDDFEAGVARGDGDLLGAVGVSVESGLGDEQLRRRPRSP